VTNRENRKRLGLYVVHKYGHKHPKRYQVCMRCGVKRRKTTSGWQWKPLDREWTANNPACALRDRSAP
jgi:hypothetical protein